MDNNQQFNNQMMNNGQNPYMGAVYGQAPVLEQKPRKGLGIASLVFGIISLLCCCLGTPIGLIGIILAIVALVKKNGKGLAIGGLVTSIIGLVIGIFVGGYCLLVGVMTAEVMQDPEIQEMMESGDYTEEEFNQLIEEIVYEEMGIY